MELEYEEPKKRKKNINKIRDEEIELPPSWEPHYIEPLPEYINQTN